MGIKVRTQDDYRQLLLQLLPPSELLNTSEGSNIWKLANAIAAELARVDAEAKLMRDEADPRTAYYLLPDWERVCGLSGIGTLDQRRAAVVSKLNELGGQSESYLVGVAAALGYTITISRYKVNDVSQDVNNPIYDTSWRFAFQVNAPANTVISSSVNNGVDAALATWGNADLETTINEDKPAETVAHFAYA